MIPGNTPQEFFGAAAAAAAGGVTLGRSVRFDSASSAYLSRTPASAGNRKTWTWSGWVKRGKLGIYSTFFRAGTTGDWFKAGFENNDTLTVSTVAGSAAGPTTAAVYRDTSAWYHIVIAFDTTQATNSNRVKLYVNGSQVTFASNLNWPAYDTVYKVNSTEQHVISDGIRTEELFDGYMALVYLIDGYAYDPSYFGETDATTGQWIAKTYSGSYGTNGFFLDFADNSNNTAATLGKDNSGVNSNNWTPNNLSVTAGSGNDSLRDHPTSAGTSTGAGGEVAGNCCTWNPLDKNSNVTLLNGNLDYKHAGTNGYWYISRATFGITSGKWYWEVTAGDNELMVGIAKSTHALSNDYFVGQGADGWSYASGFKYNNSSGVSYGSTFANGDVLGIAFDADAGSLSFYKNGSSQGTAYTGLTSGPYLPAISGKTLNVTHIANFGQRAFAYSAPSGFSPLVDTLLPTPTIAKPNTVMDVKLYTGNSSTQTISGLNFSPDLVWIKERSGTRIHALCDSVRGDGLLLYSNSTLAEQDIGSTVVDLTSDGFNLGFNSGYTAVSHNWNSITHVAWAWDAGSSNATNTSGTITSTVRANTTAGFSVVTVNSTTAGTAGHGLGVKPAMIIEKCRGAASNWYVRHKSLTNMAAYYLSLNSTSSAASDGSAFNNSEPTSTTFGVNNGYLYANGSVVYYCFAEVAGYSAFGSYTGNGSTDGPFVYTGFRPKYVLLKCSSAGDSAKDWFVHDGVRDTYNLAQKSLNPNRDITELDNSSYGIDILSNGFKIRTTSTGWNGSGSTYVYACFAEAPFPYARAR